MTLKQTPCPGCTIVKTKEDHRHQYINHSGNSVMVWYINGYVFSTIYESMAYLEDKVGFTMRETGEFLRGLQTIYN